MPRLQTRLSAYRIMWIFVFFDLPTNTNQEKKTAAGFRKSLLKNGFQMMQYSVYIRSCASNELAKMYQGRIKALVPILGHVSILKVTDKQFSNIQDFMGKIPKDVPRASQQLEFF